jgi:hypothetical protein
MTMQTLNEKDTALAQRLLACKYWQWLPGMSYFYRGNLYRITEEHQDLSFHLDCLPNINDPATLGCIHHLVRLVYQDSSIILLDAGWGYLAAFSRLTKKWVHKWGAKTEIECFINALEEKNE